MNFVSRMLKRARESEVMSREKANYESAALWSIRGMVSIWADDMHRGEKLKGHDLNKWAKDVLKRVQELNEIFEEDERISKGD